MKKIIVAAGLAAVAVSSIAAAQPARPRQAPAADLTRTQAIVQAEQLFARLDLNRDGQVVTQELQQAFELLRTQRQARMQERLAQMTPEQRAQMEQRRAEFQKRRAETAAQGRGPGGPGGPGGPRGTHGFNPQMLGPDGVATLADFREQAAQRFDRVDADRNGVITAAERQQLRAQAKPAKPAQ